MSSPDQPNPTTTTQFLTHLLATLSSLSHSRPHSHPHTHSHTQPQPHPQPHPPQPSSSSSSSSSHLLRPATTYSNGSEHETATATTLQLPEAAKPLLLTLHVLFPHCLLDALDLLDRGFVVKLGSESESKRGARGVDDGDGEDGGGGRQSDVSGGNDRERASWYVLSSRNTSTSFQKTGLGRGGGGGDWDTRWTRRTGTGGNRGRGGSHDYDRGASGYGHTSARHHEHNNRGMRADNEHDDVTEDAGGDGQGDRGGSVEGTSYHVHLTAWNCSCPAFAFAAFAGLTTTSGGHENGTSGSGADGGGGGGGGEYATAGLEAEVDAGGHLNERIKTMWLNHLQQATVIAPSPPRPPSTSTSNTPPSTSTPFPFGGLAQSSPQQGIAQIPPTCKHLLACLLAETCPDLFIPGNGGMQSHDQVGQGRSGESGQGQGRKGVLVRRDCAGEEIAAWAGGGVFV